MALAGAQITKLLKCGGIQNSSRSERGDTNEVWGDLGLPDLDRCVNSETETKIKHSTAGGRNLSPVACVKRSTTDHL